VQIGPAHTDVGEHPIAHVHEAMELHATPGSAAPPPARDRLQQPLQGGHLTQTPFVRRHLTFLVYSELDALSLLRSPQLRSSSSGRWHHSQ
jgi:hypothetical protein